MSEQMTFDDIGHDRQHVMRDDIWSPSPDLPARLVTLIDSFGYETVALELRRLAPAVHAASAPARSTDPETSQQAAKREPDLRRFSSTARAAKLLRQFSIDPMTDQEATSRVVGGYATPSAFEGCRRRCSDLRAVNYIVDSGQRRKNAGSDDESIVWTISEVGCEALERLDVTGWSR